MNLLELGHRVVSVSTGADRPSLVVVPKAPLTFLNPLSILDSEPPDKVRFFSNWAAGAGPNAGMAR